MNPSPTRGSRFAGDAAQARYERRLSQMGRRPFTVKAFANHARFGLDVHACGVGLAKDPRVRRVSRPGPTSYIRCS
jgi:hypothetical protein